MTSYTCYETSCYLMMGCSAIYWPNVKLQLFKIPKFFWIFNNKDLHSFLFKRIQQRTLSNHPRTWSNINTRPKMYNLHYWRTILKNTILKKNKTSNTSTTEFHYFAVPNAWSSITANITKREQDLMEHRFLLWSTPTKRKKKKTPHKSINLLQEIQGTECVKWYLQYRDAISKMRLWETSQKPGFLN